MMKTVCIVQARMGSSRLPGKVLADLVGRPMLSRQIARLRRASSVDELVLATTTKDEDTAIARSAQIEGIRCCRGSEHDVLGRYVQAARETRADIVVRVTADCPLIDADVLDRVVGALSAQSGECDYASNVLVRSYPRGLDVEALWRDTLLRMDRLARSNASREHVTTFARWERPDLFLMRNVTDWQDNSDLRWTVDTAADLSYLRRLWECFDLEDMPYRELLSRIRARPDLQWFDHGEQTAAA
jgi:spore coat polysaccharide biosynthesis protein SpsF